MFYQRLDLRTHTSTNTRGRAIWMLIWRRPSFWRLRTHKLMFIWWAHFVTDTSRAKNVLHVLCTLLLNLCSEVRLCLAVCLNVSVCYRKCLSCSVRCIIGRSRPDSARGEQASGHAAWQRREQRRCQKAFLTHWCSPVGDILRATDCKRVSSKER